MNLEQYTRFDSRHQACIRILETNPLEDFHQELQRYGFILAICDSFLSSELHFTQWPEKYVLELIKLASKEDDLILYVYREELGIPCLTEKKSSLCLSGAIILPADSKLKLPVEGCSSYEPIKDLLNEQIAAAWHNLKWQAEVSFPNDDCYIREFYPTPEIALEEAQYEFPDIKWREQDFEKHEQISYVLVK